MYDNKRAEHKYIQKNQNYEIKKYNLLKFWSIIED